VTLLAETRKKYDVVIIGAGIAGVSAARELAKYELAVAVLEKEADIGFGATKGTHAIVHCGFPTDGAPLKSRGELVGNLQMPQLCRELDVPFERIGKLLVAFNANEALALKEMQLGAVRNGVPGVEFITDRGRLKQMEPGLSDEVCAALYTPTTGITSPWGLVFGLMENAMANGVKLFREAAVEDIKILKDGFALKTSDGEISSSYIINAAGAYADQIAKLIGDDSFVITGSRQQRVVLDKKCNNLVRHLIRGINGIAAGDFVGPTVYGDLLAGSMVEPVPEVTDVKTTRDGIEGWIIPRMQRLIPNLSVPDIIKPFAGFIPMAGPEYHIKPAPLNPQFINLVLGGSGLTAAPAMAKYIVEEVLPSVGLVLKKKTDFNPIRKDIPHINDLSNEERAELIAENPLYGHIVCRCENVSEGEIVEAIRRGATTRDGVKFRTRAGMGRCQGGFCGPRVLKILSRELGIPVTEVTRKGKGSEEALYEIKELLN
jgi:glycerol-3-phosphate dehydrogenase